MRCFTHGPRCITLNAAECEIADRKLLAVIGFHVQRYLCPAEVPLSIAYDHSQLVVSWF